MITTNINTYILLVFTIFVGLANIFLIQNLIINFILLISSYYSLKESKELLEKCEF